jgi:hypothetical protein
LRDENRHVVREIVWRTFGEINEPSDSVSYVAVIELTPTPSQRKAPHPSVNTSTECHSTRTGTRPRPGSLRGGGPMDAVELIGCHHDRPRTLARARASQGHAVLGLGERCWGWASGGLDGHLLLWSAQRGPPVSDALRSESILVDGDLGADGGQFLHCELYGGLLQQQAAPLVHGFLDCESVRIVRFFDEIINGVAMGLPRGPGALQCVFS